MPFGAGRPLVNKFCIEFAIGVEIVSEVSIHEHVNDVPSQTTYTETLSIILWGMALHVLEWHILENKSVTTRTQKLWGGIHKRRETDDIQWTSHGI